MSLAAFLARAKSLTRAERSLIVDQALVLLEQNYVHLPVKRTMYSADPVGRLKRLALEVRSGDGRLTELDFHRELLAIFYSVHDRHTKYSLPEPFSEKVAALPFVIEDCEEQGRRRYIVSQIADGFRHPTFKRGVEVIYWNAVPIERAVWRHAEHYAGSNRDARHAQGIATFTQRALAYVPAPDEEWVIVGYLHDGRLRELRFRWQLLSIEARKRAFSGDREIQIVKRTHLRLLKRQIRSRQARPAKARTQLTAVRTKLPDVFDAYRIDKESRSFGYLRLRTFDFADSDAFVAEFVRLVTGLPAGGLIIDIRANPGGRTTNAQAILQTLTPHPIEPELLQFINTPLNLEICRRNGAPPDKPPLKPWVPSMEEALHTGALYSAALPTMSVESCNSIGQKYFGPVLLIVDALCYSAADMFAAGFQDHRIGTILGIHERTGGGGANVWQHRELVETYYPGRLYRPLPKGAGLSVAIRRALRVGRNAGAILEDFGVKADECHAMTANDLLNHNADLIDHACRLLSQRPVRDFKVKSTASRNRTSFDVTAIGMTRLDIYVDERPSRSVDLKKGCATFEVERGSSGTRSVELRAFHRGRPVARYRTSV